MRVDPVSFVYSIYKCNVCNVSHSVNTACRQSNLANSKSFKEQLKKIQFKDPNV